MAEPAAWSEINQVLEVWHECTEYQSFQWEPRQEPTQWPSRGRMGWRQWQFNGLGLSMLITVSEGRAS